MGVEITVHEQGSGSVKPKKGQTVSMHYVGRLTNGKVGVGQVIRGWDEGVMTMVEGQKATFTISPDFGYGPAGIPGTIPQNATLIFDVELLKLH